MFVDYRVIAPYTSSPDHQMLVFSLVASTLRENIPQQNMMWHYTGISNFPQWF